MQSKYRNSSFELARIICMIWIILWHIIVHGHIIENSQNVYFKALIILLQCFIVIHVNCFLLITGYFSSNQKFKQSKVWSLLNASLFYRIIIVIILSIIGINTFSKLDIIFETSYITIHEYWFIKYYIYLYILSPFINILIKNLDKNQYKKLLLVILFFFCIIPYITGAKAFDNNGFNLYHFINMYLIGAYLKKYPIKFTNKNSYRKKLLIIYVLCAITNFMIYCFSKKIMNINTITNEFFGNLFQFSFLYNNPFILLQSISFFLIFSTFSFSNKFINKVASLTIGIYLIHDNNIIRGHIYKLLKIDNVHIYSFKFFINIFIALVLIFVVCTFIEYLRQNLFRFIYNRKFAKKLREKYYKTLNFILKKINLN